MLYRTKMYSNKDKRIVSIDCFANTTQGTRLIHAVTGYSMNGIMGTRDENDYFRVKYAVANMIPYTGPVDLFYYSPEEAEEHLCIHIRESTKRDFYAKRANQE